MTTTSVREADLQADQDLLIRLAREHLTEHADLRRFNWLYRDNPFGCARAWLVHDADPMHPIGMAAMFPRKMYIANVASDAAVLGDFCIDRSFRTLGPAVHLLRAAIAGARSANLAICYDFPSSVMSKVYQRIGVQATISSVRFTRLLRSDHVVAQVVRPRWLSRPLASVMNTALAINAYRRFDRNGLEFAEETEPLTSEYTELASRVGSSWGHCTVRNAEYLNWRYGRHPYSSFQILSVRRKGELLAYCVLTVSGEHAVIVDLFGVPNHAVVSDLFRYVIQRSLRKGVATISAPLVALPQWTNLLRRMGFWRRETSPVIECGHGLRDVKQLYLVHGDRES